MSDNEKNDVQTIQYYYSPLSAGFYSDELKAVYESAGTWPKDVVAISFSEYRALMDGQAAGKVILSDNTGKPGLEDFIQTPETLIALADLKRKALLSLAGNKIAPLADAVDLGVATEEEIVELDRWKTYRVMLNRIDVSTAPDITWPEAPQ